MLLCIFTSQMIKAANSFQVLHYCGTSRQLIKEQGGSQLSMKCVYRHYSQGVSGHAVIKQ